MTLRPLLLALALVLPALQALAQNHPAAPVVVAERAFAARAVETNTRDAFLIFMADSAMGVRRGKLEPARPVWEELPADGDTLLWAPDYADMSLAGDMGFTAGPWKIEKGGKQMAAGHFATVWKRQPNGEYRWLIDMGTDYEKANQNLEVKVKSASQRGQYGQETRQSFEAIDAMFCQTIKSQGPATAYTSFAGPDSRILRPKRQPLVGKSAIRKMAEAEPARAYTAEGGQVAESGDLGFVFGSFAGAKPSDPKGCWMRVWKHEDAEGWRLVLECLVEAPKS